MRARAVTVALALLCAAVPALPASPADEARAWIRRMSEAVVNRNYDGVLLHSWNGDRNNETLRIIHRMQDNLLSERVIYLGSGNESIRKGSTYLGFDRARRVVVAQTQTRSFGFLPAFNGITADSDQLYVIATRGLQKLTNWDGPTQLVTVTPRDDRRFGYRFWLDPNSAMPIKTQVVANGQVIDTVFFVSLSLRDSIADDLLKPGLNQSEFKWRKPDESAAPVKAAFRPRANLLPPGFRTLDFGLADPAATSPETRFIVSDGISWVSVRVSVAERPEFEGSGQMSPSTFSYQLKHQSGHYVTVVGEVPPGTVMAIAKAVLPE